MNARLVRKNLLLIVKAYCKATEKSLAAASKEFYNNGSFFDELKAGSRTVTIDKCEEILKKLRDKWPPGAKWPATRPIFMNQSPQI